MSLWDLIKPQPPINSNLMDLLNEPLPENKIELEIGQIWINDLNNVRCKILGYNNETVQVLLDVNFHWTRGKTGSKKYDEFYFYYFLDNWSLDNGG